MNISTERVVEEYLISSQKCQNINVHPRIKSYCSSSDRNHFPFVFTLEMFSSTNQKTFKRFIQIVNRVHGTPWGWNEEEGVMEVTLDKSLKRKFTFYFGALQTAAYLLFLFYQFWTLSHTKDERGKVDFFRVIWTLDWINLYGWGVTVFHSAWSRRYEQVAFYKGAMNIFRKYQSKNLKREEGAFPPLFRHYNIIDIHFFAVIFIANMFWVSVTLFFYLIPNGSQYVYSLIGGGQGRGRSHICFCLFMILEIYSKAAITLMYCTDFILVFIGLLGCSFWLKFTRNSSSMDLSNKIQLFQELKLLLAYFNESYSAVEIPILCCWVPASFAIMNAFASIRFHSFLSFFQFIPFPVLFFNSCVILSITMMPAIRVLESSVALLEELKNGSTLGSSRSRVNSKNRLCYFQKKIKSLKSFGARLGVIPQADRLRVLIVYNYIANNIFTLLVTFPAVSVHP